VKADPVIADGVLVLADDGGQVVGLRPADGQVLWGGQEHNLGAPVVGTIGAGRGRVFVATQNFWVYSFDSVTGAPKWRIQTRK
jgi:outer membrane protein assembly factor BamB